MNNIYEQFLKSKDKGNTYVAFTSNDKESLAKYCDLRFPDLEDT